MKFAIAVSALLVGVSIFYYLVIFLPQKNNQQLEQKLQLESLNTYKQVSNQKALEECLTEVNGRLAKITPADMKNLSAEASKVVLTTILEALKQAKEECYKKYPQK